MIQSVGYPNYVLVSNGLEALNAAEQGGFDLILMDVMVKKGSKQLICKDA